MSTHRRAWTRRLMGMVISIHLRGEAPDDEREAAVETAYRELERVDELLSTYRPGSQLNQYRQGKLSLVDADPALSEVVELCQRAREMTVGAFDPWRLPGGFDPTGLVKGWAVERATRALAGLGDDFYLNAGGDIALHCAEPDRSTWRIGAEDPRRDGDILGVLTVTSGGIATSGITRRGTHIVNPASGEPATAILSATVTGPSVLWADVLATALVARGEPDLTWVAAMGYEAMMITADGTLRRTLGLPLVSAGAVTAVPG